MLFERITDIMEQMWLGHIFYAVVFVAYLFFAWKKPGLSLILLPFLIIPMLILGMTGEIVFWIAISITLIPVTICVVHWSPSSGRLETPWYKTVTNVILTSFMHILTLALLCLIFRFFGPVLYIVFVVGIYELKKARKFGLIIDITSTIGAAMRQSLPLPTALATAAHGHKKKAAQTFNNIAHWLTQGLPLSEALRRGYPQCPSDILAAITVADKMDQLPNAIESLQADLAEKTSRKTPRNSEHIVYPLIVLTAASMVAFALTVFIVPVFAEVISDMSEGQASLPAATQRLLNISGWMMGRHGSNATILLSCIVCVILFVMYIRFRRRNPEKPRFLSRLGDQIRWSAPVLHWFEKTLGNLHLVQALRAGLAAGYPLHTILRNAMGLDVNACYQNRIKRWLKKIEAGENITQSAKQCNLDKSITWAFDEKINKNNTLQILESIEELYRFKYNYRKNVLISASEPLMILMLGLFVGFIVYAMFMGSFSILYITIQHTIPQ